MHRQLFTVAVIVVALVVASCESGASDSSPTDSSSELSVVTTVPEFELFLGIVLLAGLWPQVTWYAAVLFFGALAGLSLYKGLSGDASCGCFGKVQVSPWYTLALDILAVAALLVWRPA